MPATTVAFHTLGCKLNYSETSALTRQLTSEGFEQKPFEEAADVYVINTCSVTEAADKECRMLVRRIQRRAPGAFVVITGCYAQLKPQEIALIEGVDLVLGAAEKFRLSTHLRDLTKGGSAQICSCDIEDVGGFHASYSLAGRTRSFLKVQDGCDYNCSFCTIPQARGASRSDTIAGVLRNVQELAENGIKEVVLTGGIERFRISSIEPNLLTEEIIRTVAASGKFMPHFHIPLQSGSDKILGAMRRRYRRNVYSERVEQIKSLMPHCAIGVDVIIGFPGESETEFQETFDFLHQLDVSYFHVFTYSERANTLAVGMTPIVPIPLRQARNKILRNLSYQKQRYFEEAHAGQVRPVLWERAPVEGMMEGFTDNYIKVSTPYRAEWANTIQDWKI